MVYSMLGGKNLIPASGEYERLSRDDVYPLNSRQNIDSAIEAMLSKFNNSIAYTARRLIDEDAFSKGVWSVLEMVAREAGEKRQVVGNLHPLSEDILYTFELYSRYHNDIYSLKWHGFKEGDSPSETIARRRKETLLHEECGRVGYFSHETMRAVYARRLSRDVFGMLGEIVSGYSKRLRYSTTGSFSLPKTESAPLYYLLAILNSALINYL